MSEGHENKAYEAGSETTSPPHVGWNLETPEPQKETPVPEPESQAVPERKNWDSQWEFLFSCISMSVGLGNVWRFPVTAYENGGGAFLIPYFIVLLIIGRPIYFLELTLGQFSSCSQIKVWNCAPIAKGVGWGSFVATMAVLTYYVAVMGITVYYFFASFAKTLPWSRCDPDWISDPTCLSTNQTLPELYFLKEVVREAANINNGIGNPDWKLLLCLLFSWLCIFGSIVKGVQSSGKVAYFTALFPYVVMLILLIRGCTLPGAAKGIEYFVKPDFAKILEPSVWYAACSQCFFSLNTGFGSIIMFSSYNPFRHNIYRDAVVVSIMDTFTSLLAGFTIFAVLGNLAHETGQDVKDVVQGGPGLAFVSYPDAIAKFDWVPQLFAVLFFLMLFTLGLGSSAADCGAIVTLFCDKYPKVQRWMVTAAICLFGFAVGIVYTTPGGQFIFDLVDYFGGGFVIYTISGLEVVGIAWIYGMYNYIDDIEFMLGVKLGWYWKICWGILIPIVLVGILIYSLATDGSLKHNGVAFPVSALVCGWLLAGAALVCVPGFGIHSMSKIDDKSSWSEKLVAACKPHHTWGPLDPKTKEEWREFKKTRPEISLMERLRQRKF